MYINEGYAANIIPLTPRGTNSTMFTECCDTAITDSEPNCPKCGRKVIGYDASSDERRRIRWANATRYWKR
jgi:hypothetical protein